MGVTAAVHPTDQTLQSYGLGKLDDASAESVNKHLDACPACRRRVAELSSDSFVGRSASAKGEADPTAPVVPRSTACADECGSRVPSRRRRPSRCPRDWPTIPITRSFASWAGAAWASSTWPNGSWDGGGAQGRRQPLDNRPGVLDRFLAEIRNAARLHHPNIVTAYSAVRLGESLVFAMEYVEGLDLSQMVKAKGRCRWPMPVTSCIRRRWACSTPTSRAWSIATSSRAT